MTYIITHSNKVSEAYFLPLLEEKAQKFISSMAPQLASKDEPQLELEIHINKYTETDIILSYSLKIYEQLIFLIMKGDHILDMVNGLFERLRKILDQYLNR